MHQRFGLMEHRSSTRSRAKELLVHQQREPSRLASRLQRKGQSMDPHRKRRVRGHSMEERERRPVRTPRPGRMEWTENAAQPMPPPPPPTGARTHADTHASQGAATNDAAYEAFNAVNPVDALDTVNDIPLSLLDAESDDAHNGLQLANDPSNYPHAVILPTHLQLPSHWDPSHLGSRGTERSSQPTAAQGGHSSPRQARKSAPIKRKRLVDVHSCSPRSAAGAQMTICRAPQSRILYGPLNHNLVQPPETRIAEQTNGRQRTHRPPQLVRQMLIGSKV